MHHPHYGRAAVEAAYNLVEATTRGFTPRGLFLSNPAARDLRAKFCLALGAAESLDCKLRGQWNAEGSFHQSYIV